MKKIRIGVSACLLGEKVRYDGQHKHDRNITDVLGQWFEFVPVCPEVELGLGVPRETMQLEGHAGFPRLVTTESGRDLTDSMLQWCAKRVKELEKENLCGFIFKCRSPSCGMKGVEVCSDEKDPSESEGTGLFAAAFIKDFPQLPVENEIRLKDPEVRESFIKSIYTYSRS